MRWLRRVGCPTVAASTVSGGEEVFLGRRIVNVSAVFVELDEPEQSVGKHYAAIRIEDAALHHFQDHGAAKLPRAPFG